MPDTEPPTSIDPVSTLTISVFTRHSSQCPQCGNPRWKRCKCRKSVYIYEAGKVSYKSAKTRSWEQAERIAQAERDARDPVKIERKKIAAAEEAERKIEEAQQVSLEVALDQ